MGNCRLNECNQFSPKTATPTATRVRAATHVKNVANSPSMCVCLSVCVCVCVCLCVRVCVPAAHVHEKYRQLTQRVGTASSTPALTHACTHPHTSTPTHLHTHTLTHSRTHPHTLTYTRTHRSAGARPPPTNTSANQSQSRAVPWLTSPRLPCIRGTE
jgi:hypothetical protein